MTPFTTFLIVLALAPVVIYAFLYGLTATWYRTVMGSGMFIDKASLALLLVLSSVTSFLGPDWAGREFIRVLVYGLLVGGQWAALLAFIVTFRRVRRKYREESE